jgi:hypothetical protein
MRIIFSLFTLFFSNYIFAQSINDRWIGTWQNGTEKIVISSTSFDKCRWTGSRPKTVKNCAAFYEGSTAKAQLMSSLNNDIANTNTWYRDKVITAKDHKEFMASIQATKKILDQVSNDKFRTVMIDRGDFGNPDCGGAYFLDQDYIYSTSSCEGGIGPMFSLYQFKKI